MEEQNKNPKSFSGLRLQLKFASLSIRSHWKVVALKSLMTKETFAEIWNKSGAAATTTRRCCVNCSGQRRRPRQRRRQQRPQLTYTPFMATTLGKGQRTTLPRRSKAEFTRTERDGASGRETERKSERERDRCREKKLQIITVLIG